MSPKLWGLCVRSAVVLRTMPTSQNRDMGHPLLCRVDGLRPTLRDEAAKDEAPGCVLVLFCFVGFEKRSGLFQVEEVSVHGHLIFAGVFRDVDDVLNTMAAISEGLNEKIDIYHADEFTGFSFG
jgi:hypothetical protein